MKNKKGVSLIVLIITIIVMVILASVVIYISADATNNSKTTALMSDLNIIEEAIKEYYLNNDSLPTVTSVSYTKEQVVSLINSGSTELSQEITENGDDSATFYKVDLSKLSISSTKRGLEEEGDTTDVYLVSGENLNAYYLKGENVAGVYYFSLSKKLTGKNKISNINEEDTSNITILNTTSGIKLTKNTSDWTNKLTIKIENNLKPSEKLEYVIAGTSIGTTTSQPYTVNVANILNADDILKDKFYASEENKMLIVNKYKTSNETDVLQSSISMEISNIDILPPSNVESSNISYTKYNNFILANITGVQDLGGSGIKEARVLYTQKIDNEGNTLAYYEDLPTDITAEYIKNSGKVFDANILKLPVDVAAYAIVFIDNAGNLSTPATYTVTY